MLRLNFSSLSLPEMSSLSGFRCRLPTTEFRPVLPEQPAQALGLILTCRGQCCAFRGQPAPQVLGVAATASPEGLGLSGSGKGTRLFAALDFLGAVLRGRMPPPHPQQQCSAGALLSGYFMRREKHSQMRQCQQKVIFDLRMLTGHSL